jgi:hypothetical protein
MSRLLEHDDLFTVFSAALSSGRHLVGNFVQCGLKCSGGVQATGEPLDALAPRAASFDERALALIRAYLQARADSWEPVFLPHNRNLGEPGPGGERYRLQRQSGWLRVRAYGRRLGINVRPHDFRHALACRMLNNGAQMSEVSAILGHASVSVTSTIYAKYDIKNLRAAYDRYSGTLEPEQAADGRGPFPREDVRKHGPHPRA